MSRVRADLLQKNPARGEFVTKMLYAVSDSKRPRKRNSSPRSLPPNHHPPRISPYLFACAVSAHSSNWSREQVLGEVDASAKLAGGGMRGARIGKCCSEKGH